MASELEYADTEELISASSESENQSENPFSQAFANARKRGKTAPALCRRKPGRVTYVTETSDSSGIEDEDDNKSPPLTQKRKKTLFAPVGKTRYHSEPKRATKGRVCGKKNISHSADRFTVAARKTLLNTTDGRNKEPSTAHVVCHIPEFARSSRPTDPDQSTTSLTPHRPLAHRNQDDLDTSQELRKTNLLIGELIQQMKRTESRVEAVEEKLDTIASSCPSSSSSSNSIKKKKRPTQIPNVIKKETRRIYKMLLDEEDSFSGWTITPRTTFNSRENQAVVNRLVREVRGMNPDYKTDQIEGAAYTYYTSCCAAESAERRGLANHKLKKKRRHERSNRKLQERMATLAKMTFTDEQQRDRWQPAMQIDMMSSEESGMEGDEEVMLIRPLPWRSEQVNRLMKQLDQKVESSRTPQARRQVINRVTSSEPSSRPMPLDGNIPPWLFREEYH